MSVDSELNAWRQQWQSETPVLPDLAARVRRQTRFMRMMVAAEVLITVVIGGYGIYWAVQERQPDIIALAVAIWIFLAAAWLFAFVNRRGCWAPEALHTAAFLELSIRRSRRALSAATFGVVLYFCEIAFCLGWIYRHNARHSQVTLGQFLASSTSIGVGIATALFLVGMIQYRRSKKAELTYLLKLSGERETVT